MCGYWNYHSNDENVVNGSPLVDKDIKVGNK
jgi:hypothetical protein